MINWSRWVFAFAVLCGSTLPLAAQPAFPTQPVHIVVQSPPGAAGDVVLRKLSDRLARALGQPIVIENRPGASGIIAANMVVKAKPDGHTVLYENMNVFCSNPHLFANLSYDPAKDFAPVMVGPRSSLVMVVGPHMTARTLAEFVSEAKASPGKLTIASPSEGSVQHLVAALLQQTAGISLTHVPYSAAPQIMVDLAAGRIDAAMTYPSVVAELVNSGRVRAIAVTAARRIPILKQVPTVAEAGLPALEFSAWSGFAAPAATPPVVVDSLNRAFASVFQEAEISEWLSSLGSDFTPGSPSEFAAVMKSDNARCGQLLKGLGIQPR